MKFVKYILVVIVIIALIFFGRGFFTPSIAYDSQVEVNKPVSEVWGVMTDESKISNWLKSITKIELVSGTPNTVGAVSNIYVEENGEKMMMKETITAIKPNEHMAMTFAMDFMDMEYEMNLQETDGKTTIHTKSVTKGNGLFAKSILSFMKNTMKKQEDENLNNLKKLIEKNTTLYPSNVNADNKP